MLVFFPHQSEIKHFLSCIIWLFIKMILEQNVVFRWFRFTLFPHLPPLLLLKPVSRVSLAFPRDEAWLRGLKSLLTKGKSNYFLFSAALAAHSHLGDRQRARLLCRKEEKKEKSHLGTLELSLNFAKSCELVNKPCVCAGIKHTLTSPVLILTHTERHTHTWTAQMLITWALRF